MVPTAWRLPLPTRTTKVLRCLPTRSTNPLSPVSQSVVWDCAARTAASVRTIMTGLLLAPERPALGRASVYQGEAGNQFKSLIGNEKLGIMGHCKAAIGERPKLTARVRFPSPAPSFSMPVPPGCTLSRP
jgi:hypothetical protein